MTVNWLVYSVSLLFAFLRKKNLLYSDISQADMGYVTVTPLTPAPGPIFNSHSSPSLNLLDDPLQPQLNRN